MPSAAASTELIVHPLRAKLDRFVTAWKSTDLSLQQALAPPSALKLDDEPMGATVLALVLAPIPVVSSGLLSQQPPSSAKPFEDASSASGAADGTEEPQQQQQQRAKPLIVPFVVLKVLSPGWASVQPVGAAGGPVGRGGGAPRGGGRGAPQAQAGRGGGKPAAKGGVTPTGDRVRIARFGGTANEHLFVHSFQSQSMICADGVTTQQFRVALTDDFMAISPGMHFVMRAWDNKVHQIFGSALEADIPPFSIVRIEMTSKGSQTHNKRAMLDLRTVRLLTPNVSAAARNLVPPSIAFSSLAAAAVGKDRFAIGTHLLLSSEDDEQQQQGALVPALSEADVAQRLAMAGLHKLNQSYLTAHLGADSTLLCTVPTGGMFLIGPDDALRYHVSDGARLLDLPFGSFIVSLDERQFQQASIPEQREWLLRMLNTLLQFRAIELLLAIDTYTPTNGAGKERPQYAFVRVHVDALTSLVLRGPPLEPSALPGAVQKGLAESYTEDGLAGSLAAFASGNGFYAVLDLTRIKRKQLPEAAGGAMSTIVQRDGAWLLAHNLYFFCETHHVVQCMVSIQPVVQGGSFLSVEEQKSRIFDAVPLLPALSPGAKRLRDDEEVDEDDDEAPIKALPPPSIEEEEKPKKEEEEEEESSSEEEEPPKRPAKAARKAGAK